MATKEEELRFAGQAARGRGAIHHRHRPRGEGPLLEQGAEELYGWSSEEALGRRLRDLTLSDELLDQAEVVASYLRAGRTWSSETLLRRKDGSYVSVLGTATPLLRRPRTPSGHDRRLH